MSEKKKIHWIWTEFTNNFGSSTSHNKPLGWLLHFLIRNEAALTERGQAHTSQMLTPWGAHTEHSSFCTDFSPAKLSRYENLHPGRGQPQCVRLAFTGTDNIQPRCGTLQPSSQNRLGQALSILPHSCLLLRKTDIWRKWSLTQHILECNREEYFPLRLFIFPEEKRVWGMSRESITATGPQLWNSPWEAKELTRSNYFKN